MFKVSYLAFALISGGLFSAPYILDSYGLGLMVGIASYVGLATAWSIFSGPTRYISLATVAFYGIGAYTMAVLGEHLAYPAILLVSLLIGAVLSLIVGVATLRLAGVYFVIFSFGLTELVVQLVTWFEVNVTGELGRYIFLELETRHIYWMLLSIAIFTLLISWGIKRSRIGLALRVIGDDEMVAKHSGIHITNIKLILFALSASIMTLIGAVQAPRWVYVEPSIVFNPVVSFLTVIMALFGGSNRLFGPVFGVIPLFLLFEWLSANFPNHYSIILGILFIGIVFVLPRGVLAFFEENYAKISSRIGRNTAEGDIK
ncbi:branched-chain amino acid ABC transporter permease [Sneathiella sp. P13V-1]|uniref:branched-chain amino acid ABC transporter permease n=1 Tax=Sneathiella sp. P13V-1 TaxID=2697366 RepID=UPI00187B508D|nr:branched-chain amino acid ABC transporter permease [Sneathiella sp. P13V-1]MBE7637478.1 branched-chain amino acid ABC transporter permease [Sneathiella sp. P13V-1]